MNAKPFLHYCLVLLIFLGSSYAVFHKNAHLQLNSQHEAIHSLDSEAISQTFQHSPEDHSSESENTHAVQTCDTCLLLFGFKTAIQTPSSFLALVSTTKTISNNILFQKKEIASAYRSRAPPPIA